MLKEVFKLFSRDNRIIFFIFILSLAVRLSLLDRFPIGITHDELNYVFAAKSIWNAGSFVPGTAPALLPVNQPSDVVIAEIPAFILSLFVGFSELSLINARLLGAIISSLTVIALFKLVKELTKNRNYAVIASLIWIINPWSFLMGRTIFEVNFFIFFFLLGLLFLLKNQGSRILLSLPFFLLGFFSYTGGQISFYLFILTSLVFHYFYKRSKSIKVYALYILVITIVLAGYIARVLTSQAYLTRGGEIFLPTNPQISKLVDYERLTSVPSGTNTFFVNKGTIYFKGFVQKYLHAFSPENLFINGEFRAAFSYQKHGLFYVIDALFIILGFAVLFKRDKRVWAFILGVIIFSSLTGGISTIEFSYSQRAGISYLFLIVVISIGLGYLLEIVVGRKKYLLGITICLVYLLFFANLLHLYFFRFPVYASDGWFFQDRQISKYIELTRQASKDQKIVVTTFEPKIIFEEYLFYSKNYSSRSQVRAINEKLSRKDFSVGNVKFTNECLGSQKIANDTTWIYDPLAGCNSDKKSTLRITRFRDVYEEYLITDDIVCRNENLGTYVDPSAFKDFSIENQPVSGFCKSWITKI